MFLLILYTGRGVGTTQTDGAPNIWANWSEDSYAPGTTINGACFNQGANGKFSSSGHGGSILMGFSATRCYAGYGRANEIRPKNIALVGVITYA